MVCVGFVVLAGCGAAYREDGSPVDEPSGTPEDYEQRIQEMRARLDGMLGIATPSGAAAQAAPAPQPAAESQPIKTSGGDEAASEPMDDAESAPAGGDDVMADIAPSYSSEAQSDCDAAGDLRDRICELSSRICRIAQDTPTDSDLQAMCKRATAACDDARRDVETHCGW